MTSSAKSPYAGYRFPGEVISHAVWLYFRFPLSLRMVEEMLAARGLDVSHETVRQWARKFGQDFANQIRRRLPCPGDKWHLAQLGHLRRGVYGESNDFSFIFFGFCVSSKVEWGHAPGAV